MCSRSSSPTSVMVAFELEDPKGTKEWICPPSVLGTLVVLSVMFHYRNNEKAAETYQSIEPIKHRNRVNHDNQCLLQSQTSHGSYFLLAAVSVANASRKTYLDAGPVLHAGALEEEAPLELVDALLVVTGRTRGPGRRIITAIGVCLFC